MQPDHLERVLTTVLGEAVELGNGGFTERHLELTKHNLEREILYTRYALVYEGLLFSEELLQTDGIVSPRVLIRAIRVLTVSRIKRVARQVLRPDRAQVVIAGPVDPDYKEYVYYLLRRANSKCNH